MKILVTGAGGFLGKFLCDALRKEGHSVVSLRSKECDLTKEGSLESFTTDKFEQIYHLAAWTQAGDFCLRHPGEQWLINQKINTHVLDWWQKKQPEAKLIAIGTSCSYSCDFPLEEEYYLHGLPIDSLFTYGMTKRMLLVGLMALHKQYGLNYLYVVPSTLYGPNYHTDGRQMHFIFDLMAKIIRGKKQGDPVVLWGDGYQKRELVHVADFVTTLLALNQTTSNQIVNIGAGEEYAIRDFAGILCDAIGYDFGKIQFDESKYVGARSKVLSVNKLKTIQPSYAPRPLKEGLKETLAWFTSHI